MSRRWRRPGWRSSRHWRIPGPRTKQAGFEAASQFLALKDHPTAACCWNDLVAIGLMNGISRAGLVPGRRHFSYRLRRSRGGGDRDASADHGLERPARGRPPCGEGSAGQAQRAAVRPSQELIKPELHVRQSNRRRPWSADDQNRPTFSRITVLGGRANSRNMPASALGQARSTRCAMRKLPHPGQAASRRSWRKTSVQGHRGVLAASAPPSSTDCRSSRSSPVSASATIRWMPRMPAGRA